MKVYISGKITGLPVEEYEKKFQDAEELLTAVGLDPVNPVKNGLDQESEWKSHMVRDIEMLFGCEAIYMLDNWVRSKGARIEHKIAEETDIEILYAAELDTNFENLVRLNRGIKDATGLCFSDYTANHRKRYGLYARLIYTDRCRNMGMDNKRISLILNRDRATIAYYLGKYDDELKYNPEFRELAQKVEDKLNQPISRTE